VLANDVCVAPIGLHIAYKPIDLDLRFDHTVRRSATERYSRGTDSQTVGAATRQDFESRGGEGGCRQYAHSNHNFYHVGKVNDVFQWRQFGMGRSIPPPPEESEKGLFSLC